MDAYTRMGSAAAPSNGRGSIGKRAPSRTAVRRMPAFSVLAFARSIWHALDTPVSRRLCSLSETNCADLVREDVKPGDYTSSFDFYLDYQAVKLMSKCPEVPTGIDTRQAALKKFIESEALCQRTNDRWRDIGAAGIAPRLHSVFHRAQMKIADILGDVPSFEQMDFRFGPGAAFGTRGDTSSFHKLTSSLQCTHNMVPALAEFLSEFPGWFPDPTREVELVPGSDLATVSKDAKTDRVICIEPLLNGLLQKGIGTWMRGRLKRFGINLDDQSVNQRLASLAIRDLLATVDFTSASDTISYLLIWSLLPPAWCELLDTARCPRYRVDGQWYSFQKFSSMGNAYTFELETLVFYALAYACMSELGIQPRTGQNISVYGDDVIIPQEAFSLFSEACTVAGFTLNVQKTFSGGQFFESCGSDYFAGDFVTPIRLKTALAHPTELIYGANAILRIADRLQSLARTPEEFAKANSFADTVVGVHRLVVQCIPRRFMVLGPWSDQDGWLCAPFDRACPLVGGKWGYGHRALISRPRKFAVDEWPMSYALYNAQGYKGSLTSKPGSIKSLALASRDESTPIHWSQGASLRNGVKYSIRNAWSSDWDFPYGLTGIAWQGY